MGLEPDENTESNDLEFTDEVILRLHDLYKKTINFVETVNEHNVYISYFAIAATVGLISYGIHLEINNFSPNIINQMEMGNNFLLGLTDIICISLATLGATGCGVITIAGVSTEVGKGIKKLGSKSKAKVVERIKLAQRRKNSNTPNFK